MVASTPTPNEDEFQELSLDDHNNSDPRFSTVPLYTPSVKSKPLTSSGPSSPTAPARRRSSSVVGAPPQTASSKHQRRTTLGSASSAGNLPLLLARLEQKSAKEEAGPMLKRASVDGTNKLVDDFKRMQVEQSAPIEETGGIDWPFWGEVLASTCYTLDAHYP